MKKLLSLVMLLLSAIIIFAQPPAPPCSNYAGVDPFSFYGNEICGENGAFLELNIITNGPPIGEFYDVIVSGTDGSQSTGFAVDDGFGFAELMPNPVEGCEPAEVAFEMIINCSETGDELDVIDLGTYTVYPQLTVVVVEPGCGEGENGSATLVAPNGEICDGPIEGIAGVDGDCENQQPGTLTYDFNPFPNAIYCFFNFSDVIEEPCSELEFGCTDPNACNFSEAAVCDDGSCVVIEPCCPRPVAETLPTAACAGGESEVCVTFDGDISAIDVPGMFISSDYGGSGFSSSEDPATNEICFILEIFNYYDPCQPVEDNFTLEYFCPETGENVNFDLGTITIYPPPFVFEVFSQPSPECGGTPQIFPPQCGELVIGEITDPINDCENLTPGVLNYDIDPGFDLTGAPDCLTAILAGELPIPPCEEDCPCEGTLCGGSCTDLMITATGLPQAICAFGGDPITIEITGQGAATAAYFGTILDSNGNPIDFFFHQPGDPTIFDIFPPFDNVGCEVETFTISYEINCAVDGEIIATDVLGDVTVYPDPFAFLPEIIEGQPCGAGTTIIPAPCGTFVSNPEPIPNPQCGEGADDQVVTWMVDLGFDPADAPECFDDSFLMGEFIVFGCPDNPGDPCFLECLGEGTLDENCNCAVEGAPQLEIAGDPPVAACQGEPFQVDVNLIGMIPPGQGFGIEILDQNGNGINFIQVDEFTAFPLSIDLFDFNYGDPCATSEVTYTIILRCFYDFSIIGTPLTLGPITIYPSPLNYTPIIEPGIPCEAEPQFILNDFCEATLNIIETVPPVDDCDAPVAGFISYEVVPAFDITNAPACFTDELSGQAPIPPCLVDCPCDGTFCQGICVDLMATASNLPAEICPDDGFQYQLDITGIGADIGVYNILTFDNNGINVGFDVHNSGDPTTIFPFIFPFVQGCVPENQTFTYEIQCPDDGSILAAGTIGTVLVYPSPFNFFPNITPSIACEQDLVITPAQCGTVVIAPDPIPVPGCGGEDTEVTYTVDFGFDYPPDCNVFPIEGVEPVFACAGTPGDPCDDGNPCTVNDVLDENCSCIGEGPTATLDAPLPESVCAFDIFTITVSVDIIPDPDGLFVIIQDNSNNYPGFIFLAPGDPLTVNVDISPLPQQPCVVEDLEFFLELRCPSNFSLIGVQIPLGTVNVFPNSDAFTPQIEPAVACGIAPVITAPECGDLVLAETPADPTACPAGNDGFVEYTVDPGFDINAVPDCFDTTVLSGQEPIIACSNCCPLVADVTVANAGPFCSGDITEVCVTFDAPFETDGQITINGIDAVAGDTQLCFDLTLVNDGCNYLPLQVPFEIVCTVDASTNIGLTPDLLIAPDLANFEYQVFPGGCQFPPTIGPGNNSPCFVSSGATTIISDPVDGCPPLDGEIEVVLDYLDDNFNPLDVAAFGCDGFDTTVLLPQPGCSTCDCPNPPANVTVTVTACEGTMLEICIEFEVGDEANAIGTQININGDAGTFVNSTLSGDGMSTIYCSEFSTGVFIDCEPVTENLNIDLLCASDETSLFSDVASTTIYPSLDKFSYEVIPAVDNCPLPPDYPEIISTGDCELDIFDVVTVDPLDGCPPTPGSLTYSVNYIDGTLFVNAPAECLFTEVTAAVEPIPACDTCVNDCEDEISGMVIPPAGCAVTGITVTIYDDMGNVITTLTTDAGGVYDSSPMVYPCGDYTAELTAGIPMCYSDANGETGPKPFTIDDDPNNNDTDGTDFEAVPIICEDEISGMVIPPAGCTVTGITVTIYDDMGNVITTLTTDAGGVYDSSPMVYPCGDYTAELTAGIPMCYSDANGETGPKPFTIDDDPNNNDTDGTDFAPQPSVCNFSVGVSAFECDDNGTMEDPEDDSANITFVVLSNGANWTSNVAIGGVTSGSDGMMLTETGQPAGTNIVVMFTSDDDPNCTFILDYTVPDCTVQIPTLSQWGLIVLALLMLCFGAIKMSSTIADSFRLRI